MATVIRSAGALFEGSSAADQIEIISGAITRTTVNGGDGDDTISLLLSGGGNVTSTRLAGQGGADQIFLSGANFFSAALLGGAGADTIQDLSNGSLTNTDIKAGDGSDLIFISGAGSLSGASVVAGGSGADTISLTFGSITAALIDGGSGNDAITIFSGAAATTLSAVTILGGGGADEITISGNIGTTANINGDSSVVGGGKDTITILGNVGDGSTVQGKGGDDEIIMSGQTTIGSAARLNGGAGGDTIDIGEVGNSARILGAEGSDLILVSGFAGEFGRVDGGSGRDTITIDGRGANGASSNSIYGGGGIDSISFSTVPEQIGTGIHIYGGAGADVIELGDALTGDVAVDATETTGYIAFESLSDSSVDAIDVISGGGQMSGVNFSFDTAAGVTSFTIGVFNDSDSTTPSITAGIVSGATFTSADSTVTARALEIDALVSTKGTIVAFQSVGEDYIFIQGGSAGLEDDAVIEVHERVTGFNAAFDYEFHADFSND